MSEAATIIGHDRFDPRAREGRDDHRTLASDGL